jgi:hypothetical protein
MRYLIFAVMILWAGQGLAAEDSIRIIQDDGTVVELEMDGAPPMPTAPLADPVLKPVVQEIVEEIEPVQEEPVLAPATEATPVLEAEPQSESVIFVDEDKMPPVAPAADDIPVEKTDSVVAEEISEEVPPTEAASDSDPVADKNKVVEAAPVSKPVEKSAPPPFVPPLPMHKPPPPKKAIAPMADDAVVVSPEFLISREEALSIALDHMWHKMHFDCFLADRHSNPDQSVYKHEPSVLWSRFALPSAGPALLLHLPIA